MVAVWKIAGDEIAVDFQCTEDLSSSESEIWKGSQEGIEDCTYGAVCSLLSHPMVIF